MNKIYTKAGDKGLTELIGGSRVKKNDRRIEAYGTIDELNSHIGLLISLLDAEEDKQILEHVQNILFVIGAELAIGTARTNSTLKGDMSISDVEILEREIDAAIAALPPQTSFILPGGCIPACQSHVCRTVCRRAERCVIAVMEEQEVDELVLQYLNRLSDYLFVLARKCNFQQNFAEKKWKKCCK